MVLGALGTVHAGIAQWLDIIPGHHNLQHLQKTVLLVVPVVLGALDTVHAGIARWLDIIPGHHNLQHYRKQCFWDLLGSFVKSCVLSRQP